MSVTHVLVLVGEHLASTRALSSVANCLREKPVILQLVVATLVDCMKLLRKRKVSPLIWLPSRAWQPDGHHQSHAAICRSHSPSHCMLNVMSGRLSDISPGSSVSSMTPSSMTSDSDMELSDSANGGRQRKLPKKRSLQKRKKPAPRRNAKRRPGVVRDPFQDEQHLKPSETMAEEMNAMKQVFMRMSEKKVQQKEERKAECKRIYKEAFERNVDKLFKRASRSRAKTLDQITSKIDELKKGLHAASEELRIAHSAYSKKFDTDIDQAQADIQRLRAILRELDDNYAAVQTRVQKEFESMFESMEEQTQKLQGTLQDAWNDRSTLSAFRPQLDRLL